MADYIDREKLLNDGIKQGFCDWYDEIKYAPKADAVSVETLKQVMWERDVAIDQLQQLGYGLGQKVEPVVERSRIDKAIEEIDEERYMAYTNVSDVIDSVLEILKKNIEE